MAGKSNIARRGKSLTAAQIRELRGLVMDGLPSKQIAETLGRTAKSIDSIIHNHARDIRRTRRANECSIRCRDCSLPCELRKEAHNA